MFMNIYWFGDRKNIIGEKVRVLRLEKGITQNALAAQLQLAGLECSPLTVLRIENGTCFVPDYEVKALSQLLGVPYSTLLDESDLVCVDLDTGTHGGGDDTGLDAAAGFALMTAPSSAFMFMSRFSYLAYLFPALP